MRISAAERELYRIAGDLTETKRDRADAYETARDDCGALLLAVSCGDVVAAWRRYACLNSWEMLSFAARLWDPCGRGPLTSAEECLETAHLIAVTRAVPASAVA